MRVVGDLSIYLRSNLEFIGCESGLCCSPMTTTECLHYLAEVCGVHSQQAVHICQDMTSAPRILAGEFSAAKIGTEEPFRPMPMPMRRRVMKSCSQFWLTAPPIGVRRQKMALMKMV